MIVYSYDPLSLQYVGITEAFASPLEPGVFLMPACTTEIAPPTFNPEANSCCFVSGAWQLLPVTPPEAPAPETLAEVQAAQIAQLTMAYQSAINAPVNFTTAAGAAALFNQNETAKGNLQNALLASEKSGTWPLNLWLNASGSPVTPFTYADLQGLAAAMEDVDAPDYQQLLTLIGQVNAATSAAAVQAIVW